MSKKIKIQFKRALKAKQVIVKKTYAKMQNKQNFITNQYKKQKILVKVCR